MEQYEASLCNLLHADIVRQRLLFNAPPRTSRIRLMIGMLSPRFAPVLLYRLAYATNRKKLKVLARFFSLLNYTFFGIEFDVF